MVTPAARREAATYLRRAFEMSERRACRVIGTDRTSVRYQGVRPDDEVLRERLKALAQERRRFGYRRLHVLLRREGHAINKKRVQRLYREERLTVRRRGGRKRAIGTRRPMVTPQAASGHREARRRAQRGDDPESRSLEPATRLAEIYKGHSPQPPIRRPLIKLLRSCERRSWIAMWTGFVICSSVS